MISLIPRQNFIYSYTEKVTENCFCNKIEVQVKFRINCTFIDVIEKLKSHEKLFCNKIVVQVKFRFNCTFSDVIENLKNYGKLVL